MNAKDIMFAINDIEDDILVEKKRFFRFKGKKLLAAAIAAAMIFSVTAIAAGKIKTSFEKEVMTRSSGISTTYYGFDSEYEFTVAKIQFKIEPQKINESAYSETQKAFNENKNFKWDVLENKLYSAEEVEDFFGIDLCLSKEIREGIRAMGERQKEYNVGTAVRVDICESKNDPSKPVGMVITFSVDHDFRGNYTYLAVYISLSDEYRNIEKEWYSYEKEGEWTEKNYKTKTEKNVCLIYNNPKEDFDGSAIAVWEENGIGYFLSNRYTRDVADTAKENLMQYIENLE